MFVRCARIFLVYKSLQDSRVSPRILFENTFSQSIKMYIIPSYLSTYTYDGIFLYLLQQRNMEYLTGTVEIPDAGRAGGRRLRRRGKTRYKHCVPTVSFLFPFIVS